MKPKTIGENHHFVPQFHLRYFTNSNNKFYIYDKSNERFKKHGKAFGTQYHFSSPNANTFTHNEQRFNLEPYLSRRVDSKFGKLLNDIHSGSKLNISPEDCQIMQYYLGHLIFRNPASLPGVLRIINNVSFDNLDLPIQDQYTGKWVTRSELEEIRNNPEAYKLTRSYLPIALLKTDYVNERRFTIIKHPDPALPQLIGDVPFIIRGENIELLYSDDAVLPLGISTFLIRDKELNFTNLDFRFKELVDIILYHQSLKYVATSSKEYIEFLKSHPIFNEDLTYLKHLLFDYLLMSKVVVRK